MTRAEIEPATFGNTVGDGPSAGTKGLSILPSLELTLSFYMGILGLYMGIEDYSG